MAPRSSASTSARLLLRTRAITGAWTSNRSIQLRRLQSTVLSAPQRERRLRARPVRRRTVRRRLGRLHARFRLRDEVVDSGQLQRLPGQGLRNRQHVPDLHRRNVVLFCRLAADSVVGTSDGGVLVALTADLGPASAGDFFGYVVSKLNADGTAGW